MTISCFKGKFLVLNTYCVCGKDFVAKHPSGHPSGSY